MRYIFLLILILSISCSAPDPVLAPEAETVINPKLNFRPNIVWLVAEDLSPVIPPYGDSTVQLPFIDRLAREGVVYDNFFSPHPVCAPARAAIITGMYANHIAASHMRTGPWYSDNVPEEVIRNATEYWPDRIAPYEAVPPAEVRMFTEYLRMAGYYCTNNAKQDYQFRKTPTAWDESSNKAHWRNREQGQPFFAVFNFEVTHESRIWAKAEDSLWVDEDLEVPVPPYLPDNDVGQRDVRRMYSNILEMDAQAAKIFEQLEEEGLLDSTIVMWYTDHGGPLPRQKRLLFDSGIKVPLIIRFPAGMFAGERDERFTSFIDLAPTALSLAGIDPPAYMEGSAFLGEYMRSEEPEYVFAAADRFDEKEDKVRAVRDRQFKYIRYYKPELPMFLEVSYRNQMPVMQELLRLRDADSLTPEQALWFRESKPEEELFDISKDPHELNNLAGDPAYAEKLQELREVLEAWTNAGNDTGIGSEVELVQQIWPGREQPATSPVSFVNDGSGLSLTSETPGASIGYKVVQDTTGHENIAWQVYDQPIEVPDGMMVLSVAHRIGYTRSGYTLYEK